MLFIVLFLSKWIFVKIDAGEKGVLYHLLGEGLDVETVYPQGLHLIAPWNTMYIYDVKIHESFEKMDVLSKNGLNIKLDLTLLFNPKVAEIGYLHNEIGVDYADRILMPAIRSVTREVIGDFLPEELYSTKREAIEDQIFTKTTELIKDKHIFLDAVFIRDVILPGGLQASIEKKLKQEQEALEYDFKIQKETKEAERKKIEAQGIAEFQRIVTKTITTPLLKWKGIEATESIAKSPNAKVVVIGNSEGDLPIILGGN
ncbi:MAG TPA: prohibitin family protein [Flavobacteriales bacterium]|nr:prohibitin family protein [Flavobacteriales bacterium]